jgi:hypothetical protein
VGAIEPIAGDPKPIQVGAIDPIAGAPKPIQVELYPRTVVAISLIDTTFDVRTNAGSRDPDRYSATLRRYHQRLWSKPLPTGEMFDLDARLHHKSNLGEFWLSSDSIVHTYTRWNRPILVNVLATISTKDKTAFYDLACTVGAFLVFPVPTRAQGKRQQSINQRRGTHTPPDPRPFRPHPRMHPPSLRGVGQSA